VENHLARGEKGYESTEMGSGLFICKEQSERTSQKKKPIAWFPKD
jgi:hypothetical protein